MEDEIDIYNCEHSFPISRWNEFWIECLKCGTTIINVQAIAYATNFSPLEWKLSRSEKASLGEMGVAIVERLNLALPFVSFLQGYENQDETSSDVVSSNDEIRRKLLIGVMAVYAYYLYEIEKYIHGHMREKWSLTQLDRVSRKFPNFSNENTFKSYIGVAEDVALLDSARETNWPEEESGAIPDWLDEIQGLRPDTPLHSAWWQIHLLAMQDLEFGCEVPDCLLAETISKTEIAQSTRLPVLFPAQGSLPLLTAQSFIVELNTLISENLEEKLHPIAKFIAFSGAVRSLDESLPETNALVEILFRDLALPLLSLGSNYLENEDEILNPWLTLSQLVSPKQILSLSSDEIQTVVEHLIDGYSWQFAVEFYWLFHQKNDEVKYNYFIESWIILLARFACCFGWPKINGELFEISVRRQQDEVLRIWEDVL